MASRPPPVHQERRRLAAASLSGLEAEALLVTHLPNIRYLTGFSGSAAMLLLEEERLTLITDSRYLTQAEEEAGGEGLLPVGGTYEETLVERIRALGIRRLAFEELHLKVAQIRFIESRLGEAVSLVPSRGVVEGLRTIKDSREIATLRRAASGLGPVVEGWRENLRPGASERELALELDYRLRRWGYEKLAFETIVASGPRSALPHGRPTERVLKPGDLVVVDFGGVVEGYASDMTRTFSVGEPDPTSARIYEVVAAAQQVAIERVRPGLAAGEVDRAAREVIEEAGFGAFFGHGTGHGLGLEVHEAPWIRAAAEATLEPGMVFTIEPGIYLPGRGGVRLEDDLLVSERGAEPISRETTGLRDFSWVCYL